MTIPDPQSFFGQKCVIILKDGSRVTRVVKTIDLSGVVVEEDFGYLRTYLFKDIDRVYPAAGGTEKNFPPVS